MWSFFSLSARFKIFPMKKVMSENSFQKTVKIWHFWNSKLKCKFLSCQQELKSATFKNIMILHTLLESLIESENWRGDLRGSINEKGKFLLKTTFTKNFTLITFCFFSFKFRECTFLGQNHLRNPKTPKSLFDLSSQESYERIKEI